MTNDTQEAPFHVKDTIERLEHAYLDLQKAIESSHQKQVEQFNAIENKIITLGKRIKVVEVATEMNIKQRVKRVLRPRIGMLNQYTLPRVMRIPKQYSDPTDSAALPRISIVTPSFNQGRFLERTILSIKEQNYPALEYIIQDGGSLDETIGVMERYQSFITHGESKRDSGQSNAINRGFVHATGDIMAYLNSDDLLLPGALHYIANYFMQHPTVDVVYGHRIVIDEQDQEVGRWILPRHDNEVILWADYIPQETLFWRRRIWDKVGGAIDESFKFAMDWDLILRFKEVGANFVRLPRFLGAFRIHHQQKTSAAMACTGQVEMERLRARVHGKAVTELEIKQHLKPYLRKHIMHHLLYRAGILRY